MYRSCNGSMLRYHLSRERLLEKLCIAIAWRLPHRLVEWCAIRVIAHATQGQFENQVVPDLLAVDALARWKSPHNSPPKGPQSGAGKGAGSGEAARPAPGAVVESRAWRGVAGEWVWDRSPR